MEGSTTAATELLTTRTSSPLHCTAASSEVIKEHPSAMDVKIKVGDWLREEGHSGAGKTA
jgi:hypothetical protein